MKSRPILFSAPMVQAILEGRKTQTRRILKTQPIDIIPMKGEWAGLEWVGLMAREPQPSGAMIRCRLGKPGDQLWVRENFSGPAYQSKCAPKEWSDSDPIWYWADGNPESGDWTKPKPSIHMPRWASRITLEITSVRVERLQDISEADALAEGSRVLTLANPPTYESAKDVYQILWDRINGAGSWDANPWVWCVEFKRVEQ